MATSPGDPIWVRATIVMAANATVEYECVHWFLSTAGPAAEDGQATADELADVLDVAYRDVITAVLATTCSYVGIRLVLHVDDLYFSSSDNTGANVGDLATDFQPPQVAVVMAKNSILGGKTGHGRFFWPLVPESLTTGFRLTVPGAAEYEALAVELLATRVANGVTFFPAHFSRKAGFLYELISIRPQLVLKRQGRRELVPLYQ